MANRLRQLDPQRLTKPIKERLDTSLLAHPKPAQSERQQPKDGRLIESPHQYRKTKQQMWRAQGMTCGGEDCSKFLLSPAFGHRHHIGGRGAGGGKRKDDETVLLCPACHEKEHPGPQFGKRTA